MSRTFILAFRDEYGSWKIICSARRAWIAYSGAGERKVLLDVAVSTSTELALAFREEFEAAKRPLLQVLDAERDLFRSAYPAVFDGDIGWLPRQGEHTNNLWGKKVTILDD